MTEDMIDRVRSTLKTTSAEAPTAEEVLTRWRSEQVPAKSGGHLRSSVISVGLVAAVVLGVAGIATWVTSTGQGSEAPTPAAQGDRYFGLDGVVVAVPSSWDLNNVECGVPMSDTVYFALDDVRGCEVLNPPTTSSVGVTELRSTTGSAWARLASSTYEPTDGGQAFVGSTELGQAVTIVVKNDPGVVFRIVGSADENERIADSVLRLDPGFTTVPFMTGMTLSEARDLAASLGLQLGPATEAHAGVEPGRIWAQAPAAGGVVPTDSVLNVKVAE